jgi:hypothetical protein
MTASVDASRHSPSIPRSPGDWPALAERLLEEFPEATITDIVRELRRAREGVEHLVLNGDQAIDVATVIARNQLNILTGRR